MPERNLTDADIEALIARLNLTSNICNAECPLTEDELSMVRLLVDMAKQTRSVVISTLAKGLIAVILLLMFLGSKEYLKTYFKLGAN